MESVVRDMDVYCRVCMSKNPAELVSLFQIHEREDEVIANMIIDCTEVMISDDDQLPQNICTKCLVRLDNAFELRKQCQRSDVAFRGMLTQIKRVEEESRLKTSMELKLVDLKQNLYEITMAEKYHDVIQITGVRCCGCNDVFSTETELETHSLNAHERQEKTSVTSHECPICGQLYSNRKELIDHGEAIQYSFNACRLCGLMVDMKINIFDHLETAHNIYEKCAEIDQESIAFESVDVDCQQSDEEQEIEYLDEAVDLQEFAGDHRMGEQEALVEDIEVKTYMSDTDAEQKPRLSSSVFIDSIDDLPCDEGISSREISDKFEEISVEGFRCCGCDVVCDNELELHKHIDEEHRQSRIDSEDQVECNRCFKRFPSSHQLTQHKLDAQNKLIYRCRTEGCKYETSHKNEMIDHVHKELPRKQTIVRRKRKPRNDSLTCCVARCYETFNSYEDLQNHAKTVHELLRIQHTQNQKPHNTICDICLKGFENIQAYTRHRTVDRSRKHVCQTCGAQYGSKANLMQHERSKCGKVATFQCAQCDKAFVTVGGLKNHQEVHGKKRSFVCDICGRAFVRKSVLNDHMNTVHSTVRLFKCSLCPKSFASRNIFQSHQLTHTKEKPYQCRYCDKRYFKTSDRTLHENQVHLGIRPFQCNYCSTSFIRDRERRLHERTHTKAKLYTCDLCTEGYNKFSEFKQHRLDEHGIETQRDLGPAGMAAVKSGSPHETDEDSCTDGMIQSECKVEIKTDETVFESK